MHIVEFLAGHPETERLTEKDTAVFLKAFLGHVYSEEVLSRLANHQHMDFPPRWADKAEIREIFKLLPHGTLVESGLISESWLRHKLEESPVDSFRYLWAILMLEIWFRLFINRPIESKCPEVSLKELLSEK
jgi:asparagine synthase (glutamine-hydrolysing)